MNNQRPYLLYLGSDCFGVEKYIHSMPKLGDSVEPIMVQFIPHFKTAIPILDNYFMDAKIYLTPVPYPGHLRRWDHVPMNLDRSRYVIFTDGADVIFQTPIPLLDQKKIFVSDEGITFGENGFWMGVIKEYPKFAFLEKEKVYNVGTFAMPLEDLERWIHFIQENREGVTNQAVEQLLFNMWIRQPEIRFKVVAHPFLFGTLYANLEKKIITQLTNVGFINNDGDLFPIVHANGNMKCFLKDYE